MSSPLVNGLLFNSDDPAPPSGHCNIIFQLDDVPPVTAVAAFDPLMIGDSGLGGYSGNVPAPAMGDAAAGKFLKADGTWAVPPISTNGSNSDGYWVQDPTGRIHQWGVAQAGTNPQSVTFPVAFTYAPSVVVVVMPTNYGTGATRNDVYLTAAPTLSGFTAKTDASTCGFLWMADGY